MHLNTGIQFFLGPQITWWLALLCIFIAVILISGSYRTRKKY